MDDDGITPVEKFVGTTTDITLKNHHTWDCSVYVLGAIWQGNIYVISNWEPLSRAGIYIGHPSCNSVSFYMVLGQSTIHVSPQFHVVFGDEFFTAPLIREGAMPQIGHILCNAAHKAVQ